MWPPLAANCDGNESPRRGVISSRGDPRALEIEMHFAVPQDTLSEDRSADQPQPSAAKQRASAMVVLLGMVICAVALKAHVTETPAPGSHQAQNSDVATPAKIIAPEFCKDQTWPYIDSRCLRRVDNPALPAAEPRIVTPPANSAAAAPVPSDVTISNNVSASSASATDTTAPAGQDRGAAQAIPVSPSATATGPADSQTRVIQSVFPTPESGAASDSGVARNDVASYQRTSDDSQRHRHWNRHSNFFGFHF
jgi:hypothetical protein